MPPPTMTTSSAVAMSGMIAVPMRYHRRAARRLRSLSDTVLETRGLTKEFKGFVAVKDVALKVRRGTIHALIGPNGAGKTTCFNLLTHFLPPTRGQSLFDGRDSTGSSP